MTVQDRKGPRATRGRSAMTGQCPHVLDVDGSDIQAEGALLRADGPATLIEMPGGVRGWAVTSADALRSLVTDPRVSKDPRQHWPAWIDGRIAGAFPARRTAAMRPTIETITHDLLDAIEQQGSPADLRAMFAYPLPVGVICHLFGLPEDERAELRQVVDTVFDTTATP